MITRSPKQQSIMLAGLLIALLVTTPAFAQQSGDKPPAQPPKSPAESEALKPMPTLQPQPTTVPGRPDIPNAEVAKQLRNVAPLPFGAPEDVAGTPTSEDGYVALMAYISLWEATGKPKWLELARRAAEWTFRFRWSYNLVFPAGSTLAGLGFRSRGADLASSANEHLHVYGLVCLPELLRLWSHTGDGYYLERARVLAVYLKADPLLEDMRDALREHEWPDDVIALVWQQIEQQGWDAALEKVR